MLFAIAASTDWLDGQIARRTGTVTALGKAIDPLVDRLLIAAGVFGLWLVDRLPGWIVFVLMARDVYLGYGAWRLEQFYRRRLPVTYRRQDHDRAAADRLRGSYPGLADRCGRSA